MQLVIENCSVHTQVNFSILLWAVESLNPKKTSSRILAKTSAFNLFSMLNKLA